MACPTQQDLLRQIQECLERLATLAHAEKDAIKLEAVNTWLEIDREIENLIGEKERAIGALQEHRKEHGC